MVAYASTATVTDTTGFPIETMRSLAVILLVSYHVIGPGENQGLDIQSPHFLRLYADFFIDVRMPFFAFIAGYLYALRPPSLAGFPEFLIGKARRLVVPGAVAVIAFAIVANIMGTRFAAPISQVWYLLSHSYAHFWFLQAVLVLFVFFGLLDVLLQRRGAVLLIVLSAGVYLSGFRFETSLFSVNGTLYLLPYFVLGVAFFRHAKDISEQTDKLTLVLLVIAIACAFWNMRVLHDTGTFSVVRHDLQSLGFGMSLCILAMLWFPQVPLLEKISPYAFTIYLYHIFGTVSARMACNAFEISHLDIRFAFGLVGGLMIPVIMHETVQRIPWISAIVLGNRVRAKGDLGAP